jgi:hypothetical protein
MGLHWTFKSFIRKFRPNLIHQIDPRSDNAGNDAAVLHEAASNGHPAAGKAYKSPHPALKGTNHPGK